MTAAAPLAEATLAPARPRRRRVRAGLAALLVLVAAGVTALAIDLTGSPSSTAASGRPPASSSPATPSSSSAPSSSSTPSSRGTSSSPATPSSPATSPGATASAPASAVDTAPDSAAAGGSAGATVPAGYTRYRDATGFSIAVPDGWDVHYSGGNLYLADPANANLYLLIQQSNKPKPNPLADWQQQAANRAAGYPDYHLIRLESVAYPQAEKAADWEFTYTDQGVPVHILNRNVLADSTHAYALYWSTPTSSWAADNHYFQVLAATFRPA